MRDRRSMGEAAQVLLINPKATYADEVAQKCFPPMGLLWLGAALRNAGLSLALIDANALGLDDEALMARARSIGATLVGLPLYAETLHGSVETIKSIARALPEAKIVVGGALPTAWPEKTLQMIEEVDFVIAGEAEESLVSLARFVCRGEPPPSDLAGLNTRQRRPPEERARIRAPLDELASPARDLVREAFDQRRYYALLVPHRRIDCVVTSRGCPHRCRFCSNASQKVRYRSIDSCLEELTELRDSGILTVEVLDDNFTASEPRALELLERVRRERLGLTIRIKARASSVTPALVEAAQRAGVYQISLGLETGAPPLLEAMRKGITVQQAARAVELVLSRGIKCHTSWIVGFPGETPGTLRQTARLIRALRPTTVGVSILRPYPGTEVYERARDDGTLVGAWSPESETAPWVRLPWTRRFGDLVEARRRLLRSVYYRPHSVVSYGREVLLHANWMLLRYGMQELRRTLFASRSRS